MTSQSVQQTARDVAASLIEELVAAQLNSQIWEADHPRVKSSIGAVEARLLELHLEFGLETFRLTLVDDLLVFEQRPLIGPSLSASRLIRALTDRGAGGLEFAVDAPREALQALFVSLTHRAQFATTYEVVNQKLEQDHAGKVRLLPPYTEDAAPGERNGRYAVPVRFYQSVIDQLQQVTVSVCSGGRVQFDAVQSHAEEMLARLSSSEGRLLNLARQDQYDAFTFGHSVRVAILALNFGRALTDDKDFLIRLGTAALLHDVGKSLIPFEILHSPARLDEEERRIMSQHARLGAELLLDHRESDPMAIAAAFGHHLGIDGRGYPRTVHPHRIATVTRIVKICDVYEALTAARPYKAPMSPIRAYRVMIGMKGAFDERLLRRFIEVNGAYPSGQLVRLSSGESARVLAQTGALFAPRVEIVGDVDGNALDGVDSREVDLSHPEWSCALSVLGAVTEDRFVTVGA